MVIVSKKSGIAMCLVISTLECVTLSNQACWPVFAMFSNTNEGARKINMDYLSLNIESQSEQIALM